GHVHAWDERDRIRAADSGGRPQGDRGDRHRLRGSELGRSRARLGRTRRHRETRLDPGDGEHPRPPAQPFICCLKGIVDPGENGHTLATVAYIDVPDDKGPGNTADPQTADFVQLGQGPRARSREYPTEIHEWRQFQLDM